MISKMYVNNNNKIYVSYNILCVQKRICLKLITLKSESYNFFQ